jgi:hypothetical protein
MAVMLLILAPGTTRAQQPTEPTTGAQPPAAVAADAPTVDVFDLLRALRHKPADPASESWDYRKRMTAFAPVVGAKPSSGVLLGAAGNVAFYRGEPATTHISSAVASLTFSTKGQVALTDRFTMFGRDDRWRLDGDERAQWTSLETHALGTSADTRAGVDADYDFFRLHHTAYYRVRRALFVGSGLYFDTHTNVAPSEGAEGEWAGSSYAQYSEAHGLPLETQRSAGVSADLLWDDRDSFINPTRGWFAKVSYRALFDGFLGGSSSWQKVQVDVRSYRRLSADGRHALAVWTFADLVVTGAAPYFDLPATGLDTYGRSARGYSEGQFRGERLAYGEIEYRGRLTRNGLLGMVAFLNTTTAASRLDGEQLFDSFATGGGAGLRLLINKRSRTNLCFDLGFGKQGSRGVYLGIQEAF